MATEHTMPVVSGPREPLHEGAVSLAAEMRDGHAVATLQADSLTSDWDTKLYGAERVYGSYAAMGMRMDRAILAQFQRGPGLESSFSGLDSFLGRDETIGFEDFLNVPSMRPETATHTPQELFERKLRL